MRHKCNRAAQAVAPAAAVVAALLLFAPQAAPAAAFSSSDGSFSLELSAPWTAEEAEEGTVLKLSKPGASLTLDRSEEAPDEERLRALLKNEALALRTKGYAVPYSPSEADNRRGGKLIYTFYKAGSRQIAAGFLVAGQKAFTLSAIGIGENELLSSLQMLHLSGEKTVLAQTAGRTEPSKRQKPYRRQASIAAPEQKTEAPEGDFSSVLEKTAPSELPAATAEPQQPAAESAPAAAMPSAPEQAAEEQPQEPAEPICPRGPVPFQYLLLAALAWGAAAYACAAKVKDPEPLFLEQEPSDPPGSYNFPYTSFCRVSGTRLLFSFSGRDGAKSGAQISCLAERVIIYSLYALLGFEAAWSCLDMIGMNLSALILPLPGGRLFAGCPEFLFLAAICAGLTLRYGNARSLVAFSQDGTVTQQVSGGTSGAMLWDQHGRTLGRLSKTSSNTWMFHNSEGALLFEFREKDEQFRLMRGFFATLGGRLAPRYEIIARGQPAGTAYYEEDRGSFKVSVSLNFHEAAHKDCLLPSLLYVKALDYDCWFS